MQKISASIVVYKNDPDVLKRTILSFQRCALGGKLIVIDNSPTDIVRSLCESLGVTYIFNDANLGFGKAHNLALKNVLSDSKYHLVLNPDVYFDEDVLQPLFEFMEEHSQVGLVMPKVLYPDGSLQKLCKLLPTPWNLIFRRFFAFLPGHQKRNDAYEMACSGYDKVMEVPFLSGCFMFLRTSALAKIGLFDERFFLYAEDTDLSRRMHRAYKTMYYPFVHIYHIHARGSYKNFRLMIRNIISACTYFTKWGWLFDEERKNINQRALTSQYRYIKPDLKPQAETVQETA